MSPLDRILCPLDTVPEREGGGWQLEAEFRVAQRADPLAVMSRAQMRRGVRQEPAE